MSARVGGSVGVSPSARRPCELRGIFDAVAGLFDEVLGSGLFHL